MIKINLCPVDELESQFWYVPDIVVFVSMFVAAYMGAQWWLGETQRQIDEINGRVESKKQAIEQLKPDLEKFVGLDQDIKTLNLKLNTLKSITVSKISRYEPLIVLEHLQNLRPEGVWYTSLNIASGPTHNTFSIEARALDNLLVAEFFASLRATQIQERDDSDLRTQVYFKTINFVSPAVTYSPSSNPTDLSYSDFRIAGEFVEANGGQSHLGDGSGSSETKLNDAVPGVSATRDDGQGKVKGDARF